MVGVETIRTQQTNRIRDDSRREERTKKKIYKILDSFIDSCNISSTQFTSLCSVIHETNSFLLLTRSGIGRCAYKTVFF